VAAANAELDGEPDGAAAALRSLCIAGAGGRGGVAEAGVGLQGVLALSVASARRTAQYADTRAVTRRGLRVPRWFRAVQLGRLRV
jgi:hypothetical protein